MDNKNKKIYYYQWLTKRGGNNSVNRIKFISYVYNGDSIKKYQYKGQTYCCEQWLCETDKNVKVLLKFREPFEKTKDISWSYNTEPIIEDSVDPITHTREEYKIGQKRKNKELERQSKFDKQKINFLTELYNKETDENKKYLIYTMIRYIQTPKGRFDKEVKFGTVNDYVEAKSLHKKELNELLNEIKQWKSGYMI